MEEEKAKQRALRESKLKEGDGGKVGNKRGRGKEDVTARGKKQRLLDGGKCATSVVEQEGTNAEETSAFQQPSLITGAKLKPYQLDGVQWMVSLDQNGISGILGRTCCPFSRIDTKLHASSGRDGLGQGLLFQFFCLDCAELN